MEIWGVLSTPVLLLLPVTLKSGVLVIILVPPIGQIDLLKISHIR